MTAPLVGLTTSVSVRTTPERLHLNAAYVRATEQAGGVPVLLPPYLGRTAREALWPRLGALILTGGGDVDPSRFGEPAHATAADISPERDALEYELLDRAVRDDVPVLGICRGLQVINVALGGSLVQDLPSERGGPIAHSQTAPREQPTHVVKLAVEGTRLGGVVTADALDVNSFHHQAVKRLGCGLRETAWAPDGVIEGLELERADRFLVAVQWHPEDLVGNDAAARALFAAVVDAARERGRR